jgi:hypothetical protein
MNISQDTFNKIVTLMLCTFFMAMYMVSFISGKTLDVQALLGFIIPIVAHSAHLMYNMTTNKASLKAASNGTDTNKLKDIKNTLSVSIPTSGENNVNNINSN